jgi:phosphatidylinositol 3,5-bisphosphate 5-phosphatase
MNTLLAVKRDLEHGVRPRLSIVCPPNSAETEPTRSSVRSSMRRPPSSTNMTGSINRSGLHRRQPTLEASVTRFERFTIYETPALFYVVCSDRHYTRFRILSLNRAIERPTSLAQVLTEDPELYTWTAMEDKLQVLAEQCRVGGTKLIRAFTAVAIVGCIRFLRGYHFTFVTQRRKIGCIGGNFIYGISATQQLSVCMPNDQETITGSAWTWFNRWINPSPEEDAEARYLVLFHFIDLTKDFFFSYSYDVTHTLQHNMTTDHHEPAEMFTWNEYLTRELKSTLSPGAAIDLILPIVLGSYEQRKCSVFGRLVSITLLARRSRHYAGTRYLKRGVAQAA